MTNVSIRQVHKHYDDFHAVKGVSLEIRDKEFMVLVGPSGCGKTTTLRMVGGFLRPDGGRIVLDGEDVTALPPERRPTATVFQSYALFPHMTVLRNVIYGLKFRKVPREEALAAGRAMLEKVGLPGAGDKTIDQLSGGEQQRVALARALIVRPKVLLLDEPLSNLDAKLRVRMRGEIRRLQREFGITALYVTHDQEEALALSDRVAVMEGGRIVQTGSPRSPGRRTGMAGGPPPGRFWPTRWGAPAASATRRPARLWPSSRESPRTSCAGAPTGLWPPLTHQAFGRAACYGLARRTSACASRARARS